MTARIITQLTRHQRAGKRAWRPASFRGQRVQHQQKPDRIYGTGITIRGAAAKGCKMMYCIRCPLVPCGAICNSGSYLPVSARQASRGSQRASASPGGATVATRRMVGGWHDPNQTSISATCMWSARNVAHVRATSQNSLTSRASGVNECPRAPP